MLSLSRWNTIVFLMEDPFKPNLRRVRYPAKFKPLLCNVAKSAFTGRSILAVFFVICSNHCAEHTPNFFYPDLKKYFLYFTGCYCRFAQICIFVCYFTLICMSFYYLLLFELKLCVYYLLEEKKLYYCDSIFGLAKYSIAILFYFF